METDILFSPFRLKNFKLKNRIGVAPMTRMSSPADSIPRQDVSDFLVRRANNGAAIVYTEAIVTDALKDADIVLSAKSLLLNPNWVEDVRAGKSLPLYKSEEANIAYTDKALL